MGHRRRWVVFVCVSLCAGAVAALADPRAGTRHAVAAKPLAPGSHDFSLVFQGVAREYIVHVPPSYDGKRPLPLVVNFHGGGGSGKGEEDESQMDAKADSAGFFVVYPTSGKNGAGGNNWNVGPRRTPGREGTADDVGFVRAMLGDLSGKIAYDKQRVYAAGLSNGGMMGYVAAAKLSDVFAAVGVVAGTMPLGLVAGSEQPISILHIHGTADAFIPIEGGPSKPAVPENMRNAEDFPAIKEVLASWAKAEGCRAIPAVKREGEATTFTYGGCRQGGEVVGVALAQGGHNWPGSTYYADNASGLLFKLMRPVWPGHLANVDANDLLWTFFQGHPKR